MVEHAHRSRAAGSDQWKGSVMHPLTSWKSSHAAAWIGNWISGLSSGARAHARYEMLTRAGWTHAEAARAALSAYDQVGLPPSADDGSARSLPTKRAALSTSLAERERVAESLLAGDIASDALLPPSPPVPLLPLLLTVLLVGSAVAILLVDVKSVPRSATSRAGVIDHQILFLP